MEDKVNLAILFNFNKPGTYVQGFFILFYRVSHRQLDIDFQDLLKCLSVGNYINVRNKTE